MLEIVDHLAGTIGERLAGTPQAHEAARYVADRFSELGLRVEIQEFPFVGWEPGERPRLQLVEPVREEIAAAPSNHTVSTPAEGITGRLVRAGTAYLVPGLLEWPRFAVVDGDGRELAYLVGHLGLGAHEGRSILASSGEYMFPSLKAIISQRDTARIAGWLDGGRVVRVHLTMHGRIVPLSTGRNVIATWGDPGCRHPLFCAHHDTAPWSPGAIDDASGVQALVDLAARLVKEEPRRSWEFVSFDANLMHFLGSLYYVKERQARGTLEQLSAAINLDDVGAGDTLYVPVWPDDLRWRLENIIAGSAAHARLAVQMLGNVSGSDHYWFAQYGVPMAEFLVWPFDDYHGPMDVPESVDPSLVELVTSLAFDVARVL